MASHARNLRHDVRSPTWEWCQSCSGKAEMSICNFEAMATNDLCWGFWGGLSQTNNRIVMARLAIAVGEHGAVNPEAPSMFPRDNCNVMTDSEILDAIQRHLSFEINIPKFSGGAGNVTTYGQVTDRHCFYLWVMKRITELYPSRDTRIVEVGAGLGMLGYYLSAAGYNDYTTIDLSHAGACQAWFLHRNLPERRIILSGEDDDPFDARNGDAIKCLHASEFAAAPDDRWDLMVNTDSMTEIPRDQADVYVNSDRSKALLSINHEVNEFSVCKIVNRKSPVYRYPFWLRDGYVEELFTART